MKLLTKFVWLLPLVVLFLELSTHLFFYTTIPIDPQSPKNEVLDQLQQLLDAAKIKATRLDPSSYRPEVRFDMPFPVYISTNKNILAQVNALQKLVKIANIKEKQIKFIDLSSKRPYATL